MNKRRLHKIYAAFAALLLVWQAAGVCLAAEGDNAFSGGSGFIASSGDSFMMILRVIGFLILIIAFFLFIMKYIARKNRAFQSGRSIQSLGGLSIGQQKSVQVIQIGHSLYVLGVGNNVELLAKIEDQQEIEYIQEHFFTNISRSQEFPKVTEWVKNLIRKEPEEEEIDVASTFQAVFQEKMQLMTKNKKNMEELIVKENKTDQLGDKP